MCFKAASRMLLQHSFVCCLGRTGGSNSLNFATLEETIQNVATALGMHINYELLQHTRPFVDDDSVHRTNIPVHLGGADSAS
mmetsp:Transcript_7228/g.18165  ORF Transcript_7228/g.18165 Transcript_7228/m.18165 type:complete len:82 (+) Transcript_7228:525-770(+)